MKTAFLVLFLLFAPCSKELSSIDFGPISASFVKEELIEKGDRIIKNIWLDSLTVGTIRFAISFPKNIPLTGSPTLVLLAGLETGKKSLEYIPDPSNYILIAYEYPKKVKKLRKKTFFLNIFSVRKKMLMVPDQILSIVKWLEIQPFWNHEPVNIAGFSFGAIFVPAIYHIANVKNISLGKGIIGYGGVNLNELFYANFPKKMMFKKLFAKAADCLFQPIEPALHLPYMNNEFLIINGKKDKNIPTTSAKALQELTPEPKTIILIDSKHIGPTKTDENRKLLEKISQETINWLKE